MTKNEAFQIIESVGNAVVQKGLIANLLDAYMLKEAIDMFMPADYKSQVIKPGTKTKRNEVQD
jgi:hypothetical protein